VLVEAEVEAEVEVEVIVVLFINRSLAVMLL
jgi:hypothetical protein